MEEQHGTALKARERFGRMLSDQGKCGTAHQGTRAGCYELGRHKGTPRGAAGMGATGSEAQWSKVLLSRGTGCCRLTGQDAAGLRGSVLPAPGEGCCRTSEQRDRLLHAPGPMRPAQPKGQSFAAPGEGRYLRYTAGRPGRAPECPEQGGEAAASGPPLLPSLS